MSLSALMPGSRKKRSPPKPGGNQPVRTSYVSNDVPVPDDFLSAPPPVPVTLRRIDWSATPLPENGDRYAVVLDNVLTREECEQLLRLAEASVPTTTTTVTDADAGGEETKKGEEQEPWQPALVNVGPGLEILQPSYRNSDRIIWDQQEVVDRLWGRCALAPGLREELATFHRTLPARGPGVRGRDRITWRFDRFNKRMRFLRYGEGQFFRPHCDGEYTERRGGDGDGGGGGGGAVFRTHYTVHLYLNDSVQGEAEAEAAGEGEGEGGGRRVAELVGGATSFLSGDRERRVDCNPRAGRVLIFQHSRLYHAGDDVVRGTKYTMRTDIMYEMVREKEGEEANAA